MQPTYQCRFRYLWRGLRAYWAQLPAQQAMKPSKNKLGGLFMPFVAVMALAFVVAMLDKTVLVGMNPLMHPAALATALTLVIAWLISLPIFAGYRLVKFLQDCCRRGWELEQADSALNAKL